MDKLKDDIRRVLLDVRSALDGVSNESSVDDILSLVQNEKDIREIADSLFDPSGSLPSNLYERLRRLELAVGYSEATHTLIGQIWTKCFDRIGDTDKIQSLILLTSSDNDIFWTMVFALPYFLPSLDISSTALSEFLSVAGKRVQGDWGSGDFFKAIDDFGFREPAKGLALLSELMKQGLNDIRLQIAAILLGALRSTSTAHNPDRAQFDSIESDLKNSPDPAIRKCYYRSLIVSFGRGATSIEQLKDELNAMLNGGRAEQTEAFDVAYRCMLGAQEHSAFVAFYFSWIQNRCAPNIEDSAKFCIVDSLWRLCSPKKGIPRYVSVEDANQILLKIQPIPESSIGIWKQVEYYLVDRFKEDERRFFGLLVELCERNEKLIEGLTVGRRFQYLLTSIARCKPDKSIVSLITSKDKLSRTLGIRLFHEIGISDEFEITTEPKPDELMLELLFLELIKSPMLGDRTSRLFVLLEPYYRDVAQRLQNDFQNELAFQAINYPGACLERWKTMGQHSALFQSAVSIAEKYFENIRRVGSSSANSFGFSVLADAVKHGVREYSQKIHDSAREQSVIAKLVQNIEVIYGDKWATYVDGVINPPSGFQTISHSVEGPRLDEIDPEGMAIRRIQAAAAISELEKVIGNSGSHENRTDGHSGRTTS